MAKNISQIDEIEALEAIYGRDAITTTPTQLLVTFKDSIAYSFIVSSEYPENKECPEISIPYLSSKYSCSKDDLIQIMEETATTALEYSQVCIFDMIEAGSTYLTDHEVSVVNENDKPIDTNSTRPNNRKEKKQPSTMEPPPPPISPPSAKSSMRTATDVIHRVMWDDQINQHEVVVGYLDRFLGIMERPITSFNWGDISTLSHIETAIPKHRIQYFKWKGDIVWDKRCRMDRVFGSSGHEMVFFDNPVQSSASTPAPNSIPAPYFPPFHTNHDRPNAFLCMRITSPAVVDACAKVQDILVSRDKRLEAALIPRQKLHCTLTMLRLQSFDELVTVRRILLETQGLVDAMMQSGSFVLSGVSNFGNRVIHADVQSTSLISVALMLQQRLRDSGISLIGNHHPFQAHVTFCKLSRELSKTIKSIDRTTYADVADQEFGAQHFDGIEFCAVGANLDTDGFYCRLGPATSNAPPASFPLPKQVPTISPRSVVVLRGVPGSGKSTISRAIAANCDSRQLSSVVCSADHYFESTTGYKFDRTKLADAHDACYSSFDDALTKLLDVVVVDNTNMEAAHTAKYAELAIQRQYRVHVLEVTSENPLACIRRSVHNIPRDSATRFAQGPEPFVMENVEIIKIPSTLPDIDSLVTQDSFPNVLYVAVFLNEVSKSRLRQYCPPLHDKVIADHLTIAYKPSKSFLSKLHLGTTVSFEAISQAANQEVQAIVVKAPSVGGWMNGTPHITLSVAPGVSAKESHTLLESTHPLDLPFPIPLSGVVGLFLGSKQNRITSLSELVQAIGSRTTKSPPSSCTLLLEEKVKTLHVFDFDLTLIRPPLRHHGVQCLTKEQQATIGTDWFKSPLSLHASQKLVPLPALAELKSVVGATEAAAVVLTARHVSLESNISDVLSTFGISPHGVFGKSDNFHADLDHKTLEEQRASRTLENVEFKLSTLTNWLEQNPHVTRVVIYEDDDAVLSALYKWSVTWSATKSIEIIDSKLMYAGKPFTVAQWLKNIGATPSQAYFDQASDILAKLNESCGQVRPFGSYSLKRASDLDLLMEIPDNETARDAVSRVARVLRSHGLTDLYESGGSRCPLLKIRWPNTSRVPIDVDIVFARTSALEKYDNKELTVSWHSTNTDERAILGLSTLNEVKAKISNSNISMDVFARCVDVVVAQLKAKKLHGTAYNGVPTFKISSAVAAYCEGKPAMVLKDLLVGFYNSNPVLDYENVFVPSHIRACVKQAWLEAKEICNDASFPSSGTLCSLMQRREACVEPHSIVSLQVSYEPSSSSPHSLWSLTQWVNWSLAKTLREMLNLHGIEVDPMFPSSGMTRTFGVLGDMSAAIKQLEVYATKLSEESDNMIQMTVIRMDEEVACDTEVPSTDGHVLMKFPRTKHLLPSPSITRDDLVLDIHDAKKYLNTRVICQEKVDGANLGFFLNSDFQIVAQNRSHFTTSETAPQFKGLETWIQVHQFELCELLSPPGRYVLYGEWLYAQHSIPYSKLPSYFLAFDLLDRQTNTFWSVEKLTQVLSETSIHMVPTVFTGVCTQLSDFSSLLTTTSQFYDGPIEGIVIRKEMKDHLQERAKLVRDDFIQHIEEHWTKKGVVKNQLNFSF